MTPTPHKQLPEASMLKQVEAEGHVFKADKQGTILASLASNADIIYHAGIKNKIEIAEYRKSLLREVEQRVKSKVYAYDETEGSGAVDWAGVLKILTEMRGE